MLDVAELSFIMNQGVTTPINVRLSDGTIAVIKYPNNPCGTPTLINEWIGSNIARKIGVTVPNFGLCNLSRDIIFSRMEIDELDESNSGVCFYTEYISKGVPLKAKRDIINYEAELIILLDHILNNFDRHEGNLFYDVNTSILYAIDYSHIFSHSGMRPDYDSDDIKRGMDPKRYLYSDIIKENKEAYDALCFSAGFNERIMIRECGRIKETVVQPYLIELFESIPTEWIDSIGRKKINQLIDFISFRVSNIDGIAEMIIKERQR